MRKAIDAGFFQEDEEPTAHLRTVKLPEVF
jgi:hypothetical protein